MDSNKLIVRREGDSFLVFDISKNRLEKTAQLPEGYAGRVIENEPVPNAFSVPLKLYIDVTNRCNLNCRHCLSSSGLDGGDEVSWELMSNILDWCQEKGVNRLKIGGGEPLVYPFFWNVVERASQFMVVSTNSNGVLVTEEIAKKIKNYNVKISISLDGDEKKHDWLRGQGVYQRVIVALKILKQAGANISIRSTLFDSKFYSNIDTIDHLIGLSVELGIPLKIIRAKACGRSLDNQMGLVNPTKAYFDLLQKIKNVTKANIEVEGILDADADQSNFLFDNFFDCGAGSRDLRIGPNLEVSPCAFLEEYYPAGKIISGKDIEDIWKNSPALIKLRKVYQNPNQNCLNCDRKWGCNGGCRNLVLAVGRPENGIDPCCPIWH